MWKHRSRKDCVCSSLPSASFSSKFLLSCQPSLGCATKLHLHVESKRIVFIFPFIFANKPPVHTLIIITMKMLLILKIMAAQVTFVWPFLCQGPEEGFYSVISRMCDEFDVCQAGSRVKGTTVNKRTCLFVDLTLQ